MKKHDEDFYTDTFTLVPVRVKAIHANCGGELVFSGRSYHTNKHYYNHQCSQCGDEKTLDTAYPYVDHKEIQ